MAAVVASVPPSSSCSPSSSDGADVVSPVMVLTAEQQARKRRREYLSSQRGSIESLLDEALGTLIPTTTSTYADSPGTSLLLLPATEEEEVSPAAANKKGKVSEDEASATSYLSDDNESLSFGNARKEDDATASDPVLSLGIAATSHGKSSKQKKTKPQRKYDPDVPMTKEEAASWRREQRRKRNRESAAASRQRQRDRIDELETELASWKSMHDDVLDKIKKLEQEGVVVAVGADTTDVFRSESPRTSASTTAPTGASTVTPRASPTASPSSVVTTDQLGQDKTSDRSVPVVPMVPRDAHEVDDEEEEIEQGWEGLLPLKMISRPAVS